ncbi:Clp protease [Rhodococcus sp. 15-1154-1]|nr:Clp protease N-terminal domain-containing protein [Rhodococcus sp. 15-1154-1]OZF03864.1 Clp protease [Rhodococcus sp. 15-1154-1]
MFEKFTDEARMAVLAAQTEARELHAPRIEPVHVFLGVLSSADRDLKAVLEDEGYTRDSVRTSLPDGGALGASDAEALGSIGIDLDAVRASLEASFGAGALDRPRSEKRGWLGRRTGHLAFASASKKALKLSLVEALAAKDSEIRCKHVLLGLIRAGDLERNGVLDDPEGLRARLAS